jgi:hypothetical protein
MVASEKSWRRALNPDEVTRDAELENGTLLAQRPLSDRTRRRFKSFGIAPQGTEADDYIPNESSH